MKLHTFDNKPCYYCEAIMYWQRPSGMSRKEFKKRRPSRDHKIPKSQGGKGGVYNIVICCTGCNYLKGDLTHDVFIAYLNYRRKYNAERSGNVSKTPDAPLATISAYPLRGTRSSSA